MPEIIAENNGAPQASAIPKHSGNATKNTMRPAKTSDLKWLKMDFNTIQNIPAIYEIRIMNLYIQPTTNTDRLSGNIIPHITG